MIAIRLDLNLLNCSKTFETLSVKSVQADIAHSEFVHEHSMVLNEL